MKQRVIKIIGALALCLALAVPTVADDGARRRAADQARTWLSDDIIKGMKDDWFTETEGQSAYYRQEYINSASDMAQKRLTREYGQVSNTVANLNLNPKMRTSWAVAAYTFDKALYSWTADDMRRYVVAVIDDGWPELKAQGWREDTKSDAVFLFCKMAPFNIYSLAEDYLAPGKRAPGPVMKRFITAIFEGNEDEARRILRETVSPERLAQLRRDAESLLKWAEG